MKQSRQKNIDTLVHGSTGAGNDQYRFDLVAYVLGQGDAHSGAPAIKFWRLCVMMASSANSPQQFLKDRNITVSAKTAYSYNVGLWGVSIGGKETHTAE